jgi:hypothetical protein
MAARVNPFAQVFRPDTALGNPMFHFRSSKMLDHKMIDYMEPLTIALIPALIVIDWAIRGRKHDSTHYWRLRATAVTIATFYLAG